MGIWETALSNPALCRRIGHHVTLCMSRFYQLNVLDCFESMGTWGQQITRRHACSMFQVVSVRTWNFAVEKLVAVGVLEAELVWSYRKTGPEIKREVVLSLPWDDASRLSASGDL